MPLKKHGQLYEDKGTPYENLGTLCENLGMLSMFAGMPYEGEKGIREESRGHRAVLPVPHPFRKARCRREEPLSQRQATLRAFLGVLDKTSLTLCFELAVRQWRRLDVSLSSKASLHQDVKLLQRARA